MILKSLTAEVCSSAAGGCSRAQKIVRGPRANAHERHEDDTNADPSDSGLARRTVTWLTITSQKILGRPLDRFSAIDASDDDATTVSVAARLGRRDGSKKHLISGQPDRLEIR